MVILLVEVMVVIVKWCQLLGLDWFLGCVGMFLVVRDWYWWGGFQRFFGRAVTFVGEGYFWGAIVVVY